MQDYSSYLRSRGIQPIKIERTPKKRGHIVLHNSVSPIEVVDKRRAV